MIAPFSTLVSTWTVASLFITKWMKTTSRAMNTEKGNGDNHFGLLSPTKVISVIRDGSSGPVRSRHLLESIKLVPPQWVQCDLRSLDLSVLGKFSVIMADPPWDIHMELPYGTMSDDEMRQLPVPSLQVSLTIDDFFIPFSQNNMLRRQFKIEIESQTTRKSANPACQAATWSMSNSFLATTDRSVWK